MNLKRYKIQIIVGILLLAIVFLIILCFFNLDARNVILSSLIKFNNLNLIITILGIFATVSVTFLTLLFAIAAINASFQVGNNTRPYDYISEGGSYPLKLLIKVDLMSTAKRTIIAQLFAMVGFFILCPVVNRLSEIYTEQIDNLYLGFVVYLFGVIVIVVLGYLLYLLIHTLWNTTNSVYYSIVQYNYDYQLSSTLTVLNKGGYFSLVKSYCPQPYDVYSVKKTLYPNIHNKIYKTLHNKNPGDSKEELVSKWNQGFKTILQDTLDSIRNKHGNNITLIKGVNIEGGKYKEDFGLLEILIPKIQAPEKVTKICLDLLYHAPTSKEMNLIPYDKETLEQCLILLAAHKYYAESRQEEREKHNVNINRDRYSNPNDMHAYMLYGYILFLLGEYERRTKSDRAPAKEYYKEAIESYKCAIISNPINEDAKDNLEILRNYVNSPPLSMNL